MTTPRDHVRAATGLSPPLAQTASCPLQQPTEQETALWPWTIQVAKPSEEQPGEWIGQLGSNVGPCQLTTMLDVTKRDFSTTLEELRRIHCQDMATLQREIRRLQHVSSFNENSFVKSSVVADDHQVVVQQQYVPDGPARSSLKSGTRYPSTLSYPACNDADAQHVDFPPSQFEFSAADEKAKNESKPRPMPIQPHALRTNSAVAVNRAQTRNAKASFRADITPKGCIIALLETAPPFVIVANACTMGISADVATGAEIWDVFEYIWLTCYALEFLIQVYLYGLRWYFLGPSKHWNWFDFGCLSISLVDVLFLYIMASFDLPDTGAVLGILKILRLARLARLVRTLRYRLFDELKQMVLGVVFGIRVLIWAIVLLFVIIAIMGIAMRELIGNDVYEMRTVPNAMFTIFRCYTDGCTAYDGTPLSERLFTQFGPLWFFGYILSFMFVTCGVFNLIMAIFIDNVTTRSLKKRMRDIGSNEKTTMLIIKDTLAKLVYETHPDFALEEAPQHHSMRISNSDLSCAQVDGEISRTFSQIVNKGTAVSAELFNKWLLRSEIEEILMTADVDTSNKDDLFDVLDVDMGGELGLDELIDGLMRMRGPITKSDIVATRLKLEYAVPMIEDIWRSLHGTHSHHSVRSRSTARHS